MIAYSPNYHVIFMFILRKKNGSKTTKIQDTSQYMQLKKIWIISNIHIEKYAVLAILSRYKK